MRSDVCREVVVQPLVHLHAVRSDEHICARKSGAGSVLVGKARPGRQADKCGGAIGCACGGLWRARATMRALLMPVSSLSSRTAAVMGFS